MTFRGESRSRQVFRGSTRKTREARSRVPDAYLTPANDVSVYRQHVHDLPLALVAPLSAEDHRDLRYGPATRGGHPLFLPRRGRGTVAVRLLHPGHALEECPRLSEDGRVRARCRVSADERDPSEGSPVSRLPPRRGTADATEIGTGTIGATRASRRSSSPPSPFRILPSPSPLLSRVKTQPTY